ncbi:MAG TPA: hypothetical protein VKM93_23500 [Terriglobia bacterium]|nr:hypothetical protein [Terriglobia bacterium]
MNWATFYLICFLVGLVLSVISLLSGMIHFPGHLHVHLPHVGGHHGGGLHAPGPHVPGPHGATAPAGKVSVRSGSGEISPFNFITLMAFLAWFGGTGYLLTEYSRLWFALGMIIATFSGLGGAAIVFAFISRVLLAHETILDEADYVMTGVLGTTSVGIRAGGTGEIVYSQGGTRHTCGARSEDGVAIAKGSEVVVERFEKGIAYVRRWDDMTK